MARSTAKTPAAYLASLPADRRATIAAVRRVVKQHMPKGFRETMNWGAITWEIPLRRHPQTPNGQPLCYVSLSAHKNFSTLYLMGAYVNSEQYRALKEAFANAGKKFDMGKSCLHFKRVEDLDLDAIGRVIASFTPEQWIAVMDKSRRRERRLNRKESSMSLLRSSAVVLALATLIATGTASAQERKITRRQLPPAVARTVTAESRGAKVRGYAEEKEHGQTFYEAEMTVHGHTRDVLIDSSGAVVEVEEQVKWSALPPAVQAGLRAGAGRGRIGKIESITKSGQLVAYEAHVVTNGKRSEVQVGPDGKPLAQEQ